VKRAVLVGTRILKQAGQYLTAEGFEASDLCVQGWFVLSENVVNLMSINGL
jgi:hypothetical protein